jgi:hypothetical protein
MDVRAIVEGWTRYVMKDPVNEKEALRRAEICITCSDMRNAMGVLICGQCGCPLAAKTRSSLSDCPNPESKGGSKWKR